MRPTARPERRVRRSAEEIVQIQERITTLLEQGGKLTSEEIQETLGLSKADILRPLQLLRSSNEVRAIGELRSMRYYVVSSSGRKLTLPSERPRP